MGYLAGMEAQGPCTQLCVFERKGREPLKEEKGWEERMEVEEVKEKAVRCEELGGEGQASCSESLSGIELDLMHVIAILAGSLLAF